MTLSCDDEQVLADRRWAYLVLSLTAGLGPITLKRAVRQHFSVLGLLKLSHTGWAEVDGIGSHRASQILRDLPRATREAEQTLRRCQTLGIQITTLEDPDYPAQLLDLDDAPSVLYFRGTLEPRDLSGLAMVGSRKCSFYGRDQALRFSSLLAGAGFTVVSGGARGVDSHAHEGALKTPGGRTLAVLGCGVDIAYPPENKDLFDQITRAGAVISHYPPGTAPNARHFPERNRVISALSRGVLVIEADERSGSLITARIAADDHNRPVLALPGRLDNPLSAGPHSLIQQGATLVTSLQDILDALGPLPDSMYKPPRQPIPLTKASPSPLPTDTPARTSGPQTELPLSPRHSTTPTQTTPPDPNLSDEQARIIAALSEHREAPPDLLIESTGLPPQIILRELTLLTLKGKIRRIDAQTYALPK